jgi:hypothetical protein
MLGLKFQKDPLAGTPAVRIVHVIAPDAESPLFPTTVFVTVFVHPPIIMPIIKTTETTIMFLICSPWGR